MLNGVDGIIDRLTGWARLDGYNKLKFFMNLGVVIGYVPFCILGIILASVKFSGSWDETTLEYMQFEMDFNITRNLT